MQFQITPPNPKRRSKSNIFPEKYHLELQKSTQNFKSDWTHTINELQFKDVILQNDNENNNKLDNDNDNLIQALSFENIRKRQMEFVSYKEEQKTQREEEIKTRNTIFDQKSAIIYSKFIPSPSNNISNEIPKQVFMCWSTLNLPTKMREAVNRNKELNPDFTFYLYDDNMCREFIEKYFENDVLYAFNKLIPGAYKADLWRLCILFIKGGIYIDIKYQCINGFTFSNVIDKEYLTLDIPSLYWSDKMHGIYNAFMVCRPNNIFLWKCITKIVENVNNEYYGKSCLFPTGPGLLGDIYFQHCNSENDFLNKLTNDFECVFSTNIKNIVFHNTSILEIYPEYRQDQENENKEYYSVIYANRNIYDPNVKAYSLQIYPIQNTYNSIIPLKIYQTWYSTELPELLQTNVNLLKEQNPEFEFYLYDDNHCREFIQNHFDISVVNAFDKLIPGAYKADLFRYCILYIQGGIYIDIKYVGIHRFKFIALTEKEYFVRDIESSGSGIYNALMICKPGNEILWKAIQKIVQNVSMKFYGNSSLEPTGPMLLKTIIDSESISLDLNYLYHIECVCKKKISEEFEIQYFIYDVNNHISILTYPNEYRELQKNNNYRKRYYILWEEHNIYY